MSSNKRLATGRTACAAWLVAACCGASAQGMPPPGGMPPGKGPPGAERPAAKPDLEAMLPPDPWRSWHAQLAELRACLGLAAGPQATYDALLRELDDVQRLNARRVMRALRQAPPAVSARPDAERDILAEAAEATDWATALGDLAVRWRALRDSLPLAERAKVDAAYQKSLELSRARGR